MNNLISTIKGKDLIQQELDKAIKAYLDGGGEIREIPYGVIAEDPLKPRSIVTRDAEKPTGKGKKNETVKAGK